METNLDDQEDSFNQKKVRNTFRTEHVQIDRNRIKKWAELQAIKNIFIMYEYLYAYILYMYLCFSININIYI